MYQQCKYTITQKYKTQNICLIIDYSVRTRNSETDVEKKNPKMYQMMKKRIAFNNLFVEGDCFTPARIFLFGGCFAFICNDTVLT